MKHKHSDNDFRCLYDDAQGRTRCAYETAGPKLRHLLWLDAPRSVKTFCGAKPSRKRDTWLGNLVTCPACNARTRPKGLR